MIHNLCAVRNIIDNVLKYVWHNISVANSDETLKTKLAETESELEELRKDQEDLLELLSDQQLKLSEYRSKMRAAELAVTDDEEYLDEE